jgi:hypothetical protein
MGTAEKDRAEKSKVKSAEYYNRFFGLCDDFIEVMPEHKYAKDFVGMMGSGFLQTQKIRRIIGKICRI